MDCGIGGVDERVEQESETGYRRIERVLVTRTLHQGGSNLRYIRSRVALTGR